MVLWRLPLSLFFTKITQRSKERDRERKKELKKEKCVAMGHKSSIIYGQSMWTVLLSRI